ncbi:MAG: uroporphyrinogen-III synthase [Pseudomonadota bacterium]
MMQVLVTRSAEDGARTGAAVAAKGWRPVLAPAIRIRFFEEIETDLENIAAIALTSANGARALAALKSKPENWRGVPVFAVGRITAEAAKAAGFENVETASGTVASLADLIAREYRGEGRPVLHAVGRAQAGDLAGVLAEAGVPAQKTVLYDAEPVAALPEPVQNALSQTPPALDWATFFSPRTARVFIDRAEDAGLVAALGAVRVACLSPAVAEAAGRAQWRTVVIADEPTEEALLRAIEQGIEA